MKSEQPSSLTLRLSGSVKEWVAGLAKANKRSMSAEIIYRLERVRADMEKESTNA